MSTLGEVFIPDGTTPSGSLQWVDENQYSPVDQVTKRTVGGKLHVRSHSLDGGRLITLEAFSERCWIPLGTRNSLQVMADVAGQEYDLVWNSQTYRVIFRHEEPPALSLKPLFHDSQVYVGQIKLLEIST